MIHTLYKTTNRLNGRFYVGVHSTEDTGFGTDTWKDQYIGSGKLIEKALKKYGRDTFVVEVICYFDNEDSAYASEADIVTEEWLKQHKRLVYNQIVGGFKPPNHREFQWLNNGTTECRWEKGKEIPDGWINGRLPVSIETRQKQSVNALKNGNKPPKMTKIAARKAIETRIRNGTLSHKQPPISEQHRAILRKVNSGIGNPMYGSHYRWITDGITNRRLDLDSSIPIGFRLGRINHKDSVYTEDDLIRRKEWAKQYGLANRGRKRNVKFARVVE